MRLAAVLMLLLTISATANAAEENSLIMQKYGEAGVKKMEFFENIENNTERPFAREGNSYKTDMAVAMLATERGLSPFPGKALCKTDHGPSLHQIITRDHYALVNEGKEYKLTVEKTSCSYDTYDEKKKIHQNTLDVTADSSTSIFRDGVEIASIGYDADIYIKGADMIAVVSGACCNMERYFNHYDWVTGETIEEEALQTSLDDAPSAEGFDINKVVLPSGETIGEFEKRTNQKVENNVRN